VSDPAQYRFPSGLHRCIFTCIDREKSSEKRGKEFIGTIRKALITGASSGLGYEIARILMKKGVSEIIINRKAAAGK
jgi:hypothetical protein